MWCVSRSMCPWLIDTWCVVSVGECFLAKGYFVGATRVHFILFISLPPSLHILLAQIISYLITQIQFVETIITFCSSSSSPITNYQLPLLTFSFSPNRCRWGGRTCSHLYLRSVRKKRNPSLAPTPAQLLSDSHTKIPLYPTMTKSCSFRNFFILSRMKIKNFLELRKWMWK